MALVLCFGTVVLADQLMQPKVRNLQDPATINQASRGFQVSMETYLTVVYEDHALIKKKTIILHSSPSNISNSQRNYERLLLPWLNRQPAKQWTCHQGSSLRFSIYPLMYIYHNQNIRKAIHLMGFFPIQILWVFCEFDKYQMILYH